MIPDYLITTHKQLTLILIFSSCRWWNKSLLSVHRLSLHPACSRVIIPEAYLVYVCRDEQQYLYCYIDKDVWYC